MTLMKSKLPTWRYFADAFDHDLLDHKAELEDWVPAMNVIENDNSYRYEFAVPGFAKEDFDISIDGTYLAVNAKTSKETEEVKDNYTRKEFSCSSFTRRFELPLNADIEEVNAKYEEGILYVDLKKKDTKQMAKKNISIE